jgi:hypothetical protein
MKPGVWWCAAPALGFPGVLLEVMRLHPLGPRLSQVWGPRDYTYRALLAFHPRPSTGGGWGRGQVYVLAGCCRKEVAA